MAKILIAIPRTREYKPFLNSLPSFVSDIKKEHTVQTVEVWGKKRDEAREHLFDVFKKSDCDYLLFLDDDHSGHEKEMLDALIRADVEVCAIKCYSRWFPYQCTCYIKDKVSNQYFSVANDKGTLPCHFVGFGMTLVRRDLLDKVQGPYFQCDDRGEREDNYFCQKLIDAGIYPHACFDYVLPHNGIDDSNVMLLKTKGASTHISRHNNRIVLQRVIDAKMKAGLMKQSELRKLVVLSNILDEDFSKELDFEDIHAQMHGTKEIKSGNE